MILVSGSYYHTIKKVEINKKLTCPHCEASLHMTLELKCMVKHVMFVPIYPYGKEIVVCCPICNKLYYHEGFPDIPKRLIEELKKVRYPWYYYIALAVILGGISVFIGSIVMYRLEATDRKIKEIEAVYPGKVIFYKLEDASKSVMYVTDMVGDTLYVRQNKKAVTTGDVTLIDEPENYTEKVTIFTKSELKNMAKDKKVLDIYLSTTAGAFNPELFE